MGARLVVDDDRRLERFAKRLREDSRGDVAGAAGCEWNDDADGPAGDRPRRLRTGAACGGSDACAEDGASSQLHEAISPRFRELYEAPLRGSRRFFFLLT